jgi:hypothetical protein
VRDEIGLTLVFVAWLIDRADERHALALLNNVRRFMRGQMQIGLRDERDLSVGCERLRAQFLTRIGRPRTHMRADARDVVTAKACLDLRDVRERSAAAFDALPSDRRRASLFLAPLNLRNARPAIRDNRLGFGAQTTHLNVITCLREKLFERAERLR